jgi:ADP-ribosylglycohydrolase
MNFKDLLLGIAIGDAYGAGVEFMDRDWVMAHVDFSEFVNARHLVRSELSDSDVFTRNYTAWDYTDDTEMTIGLINALLSGQEFTCELLIKHWTLEYQDGIARKGYGRNGHGSMRWVYSGEKTIEEVREFQKQTIYPGNVPVMRAVPLGLLPNEWIDSFAYINADATHPHPKARAASLLVARAAEYVLIQEGESEYIIPYCQGFIKKIDIETETLLQKIDQLPGPEWLAEEHYTILCGPQPIQAPLFLPGILGLPSDAMHTAGCILYVLKHATDTMNGLKHAIYLGGDVDSVASVCTGILAGRYGLETLPAFMKNHVEGRQKLENLAAEFVQWMEQFDR